MTHPAWAHLCAIATLAMRRSVRIRKWLRHSGSKRAVACGALH
jgi:hypothetical protein